MNKGAANENKSKGIAPVLIGIIVFLLIGIVATYKFMSQRIMQIQYNCTPITNSKEEMKLELDSTLVQSLYSKVVTNIREDIAQPNFNDEMKLYLAYRQIPEKDKYISNCNKYDRTVMEPYFCETTTRFTPTAFKEEVLVQKLKEMYGENVTIPLKNIQLGKTCVIGYQYIPSRGEYVEGYCNDKFATTLKVNKKLTKATSTRNTIILEEEVKYQAQGGATIPDSLKSGTYYYTFRLDMNYNYVLISKTYESKY